MASYPASSSTPLLPTRSAHQQSSEAQYQYQYQYSCVRHQTDMHTLELKQVKAYGICSFPHQLSGVLDQLAYLGWHFHTELRAPTKGNFYVPAEAGRHSP